MTRPPAAPGETAALDSADAWLDAATLVHARSFALGEERNFSVDQDAGRLSLHFADGATLDLSIGIIGSFRPQDRTFRWAWANTSVDARLTLAARSLRESQAFPAATAPTIETSFDDCRRLAAVAAVRAGADGVYRCITDDSLSVFVAYTSPARPDNWMAGAAPDLAADAVALLDRYDAEMLPLDMQHEQNRRRGDSPAVLDRLLKQKMSVYERAWARDDDYWAPSSFSWPSDHDPAERGRRFALPRRAGGVFVVTERSNVTRDAHVVARVRDGVFIVDMDLDWGKGLLMRF